MCSEWLPIETAPKDAYVLLFYPKEDGFNPLVIAGNERRLITVYNSWRYPSHWMPLPPPPVPEQ